MIELGIPKADEVNKKAREDLEEALQEYAAISGRVLDVGSIADVLQNPRLALEKARATRIEILSLSDEHAKQRLEHERARTECIAKLRKHQNKLASIRSSIEFAKQYSNQAAAVSLPTDAELHVSECPFCRNRHHAVENQANRLEHAISWLNQELKRSSYLLESFEEDERLEMAEIERIRQAIRVLDHRIDVLDKQIADLEKHQSQHELTLNVKWQIEALLQNLLERRAGKLVQELEQLKRQISLLQSFLDENYRITGKLAKAEEYIRAEMENIGNRFEFESSYRPIKLHFSLSTFDLWHQSQERKVFLRSMGSGANWLYCHLTLFLALHRYFCSLGDSCNIPSILFLDQPSQVYFPSVVDNTSTFEPERLAELEGDSRKRSVDEDIQAVRNLYSQLVSFCKETLVNTGIEPQIIVTDHADNLELDGDVSFDSLVQDRRWRTRGFVALEESKQPGL